MELCANTAALRSYMAQMDRGDRMEHAIASRTDRLMDDSEFNPLEECNIAEAVSEVIYGKSGAYLVKAMQKAMLAKSGPEIEKAMHTAGLLLVGAVRGYWYAAAKRRATDEINDATCGQCFDEGCPRCCPAEEF